MKAILKLGIEPMFRRLGTALSGYLVGAGYTESDATAVASGLTIGALILVDLICSYTSRYQK